MSKAKVKEIINKIKKKWFIYFLIFALVTLAWGIYYGRLVETPPAKVLYVWVTPAKASKDANMTDKEYQDFKQAVQKSGEEIDKIMQAFKDNYSELGFKKYRTQQQSLSNSEERLSYNNFNAFDGDISILPISYFERFTEGNELEDNRFSQLMDLGEYSLNSSKVEYIEGLNHFGEQIKVAIKLNAHYALAVSLNVTAPSGAIEQLLNIVLDTI